MQIKMTRRRMLLVGTLGASALGARSAVAADADGVSRAAESIHQEPLFAASRARVYSALTDARQFDRIVELSGAAQQMHLAATACQINAHPGGRFTLFGGYITGRQVALEPNELIVQAWRAGNWPHGLYSIVRFELVAHETGCRIVFDQAGFPRGEAESLASGWHANYWDPLQQLLS